MQRFLFPLLLPLLLLCLVGCSNRGNQLDIPLNDGEFFYTDSVRPDEAQRVANYLAKQNYFDGTRHKIVQLDKQNGTYLFRANFADSVLEGSDNQVISSMRRAVAMELSKLLDDQLVEIQMCDDGLNTVKTIPQPNHVTRLSMGQGDLFFTNTIKPVVAERLRTFLLAQGFTGKNSITAQLNLQNTTWQFRIMVLPQKAKDPDYIATCRAFGAQLSSQVFGGAPVEVHLCDLDFRTLHNIDWATIQVIPAAPPATSRADSTAKK